MTNSMIIIFMGSLIVFILLVFLISVLNNHKKIETQEQEKDLQYLNQLIQAKHLELDELQSKIKSHHFDKQVSLPTIVNEVLNIYEKSNIKVPADIIEDISIMIFESEVEAFNYIENQRHYWKLENTKKPYKRVK